MRTYDYTFLGGADDADDVCEERPRISRREGTSYGTFLEETILSLSSTAGQVEENETDSDELELELKSRPATLNPEEMCWRVHLVQTGETLAGLALHYGLTVEDIKRANGLAGDSFGVKMEVNIPKQSGVTSATEVYRMVRFSSFFFTHAKREQLDGAFRQMHGLRANHGTYVANVQLGRSKRKNGMHGRHMPCPTPIAALSIMPHGLTAHLSTVGRVTEPHRLHLLCSHLELSS